MTNNQADKIFRTAYAKAREQYGVRPSIRIARFELCAALNGNAGDPAVQAIMDGAEAREFYGVEPTPEFISLLHRSVEG